MATGATLLPPRLVGVPCTGAVFDRVGSDTCDAIGAAFIPGECIRGGMEGKELVGGDVRMWLWTASVVGVPMSSKPWYGKETTGVGGSTEILRGCCWPGDATERGSMNGCRGDSLKTGSEQLPLPLVAVANAAGCRRTWLLSCWLDWLPCLGRSWLAEAERVKTAGGFTASGLGASAFSWLSISARESALRGRGAADDEELEVTTLLLPASLCAEAWENSVSKVLGVDGIEAAVGVVASSSTCSGLKSFLAMLGLKPEVASSVGVGFQLVPPPAPPSPPPTFA